MYVYSPPIHVWLLASGLYPSAHSQNCLRQTYARCRQSLVVRQKPFSSGKLIFLYAFIIHTYFIYKYIYTQNKHTHTLLYMMYEIRYEIDLLLLLLFYFCEIAAKHFASYICGYAADVAGIFCLYRFMCAARFALVQRWYEWENATFLRFHRIDILVCVCVCVFMFLTVIWWHCYYYIFAAKIYYLL